MRGFLRPALCHLRRAITRATAATISVSSSPYSCMTMVAAASGPLLIGERLYIELLWHRCKHYWVWPEDYATDLTLLDRVEYVLRNVGKNYIITFA